MFEEIKKQFAINSIEPINKGWSNDHKYYCIGKDGKKYVLRISDISKYELKAKEYEIINKFSKLGFEMSKPIAFGKCDNDNFVFMLLSYVEGNDLESILPTLDEKEQYDLGYKAGIILRKIHSLELYKDDYPHKTKKEKKLEQLRAYENCLHRIPNDDDIVKFIYDHIDMMWREKPAYLHGDFHPGNLIYMENGEIGVIDFNRCEVGDPYEDFYKLQSFAIELSIPYCKGQIDAYFGNDVPHSFWVTLAVYVAHASLFSIKWAEKFSEDEVDGMVKRCYQALEDYDYFKLDIPKWY